MEITIHFVVKNAENQGETIHKKSRVVFRPDWPFGRRHNECELLKIVYKIYIIMPYLPFPFNRRAPRRTAFLSKNAFESRLPCLILSVLLPPFST